MKYIEILANGNLKWVKLDEKSIKKYKNYTIVNNRVINALKARVLELYCLLDNNKPVAFLKTSVSIRKTIDTVYKSDNEMVIDNKYIKYVIEQINELVKLGYELTFYSFIQNDIVMSNNKVTRFSSLSSFETPKHELAIIYQNTKKLPDTLVVNGTLDLSKSNIDKLPSNLKVKKELILNDKIKEFPKNSEFYNLDMSKSNITKLPDNLTIQWNLTINGCKIKKLPKGLKVGNNLNLFDTPISEIPKDLEVGGNIYLSPTMDIKIPKNLVDKVKKI